MNKKIIAADRLAEIASDLRSQRRKLVFTNGCFDLLHLGHVRYLEAARELGDALAVGINGDESVRELKGAGRPLNFEGARAEVIAALACVDYVVVFPDARATRLLEQVRPEIYVKGGDYTPASLHAEEGAVLKEIGADIHILPLESGYSTSGLIERLRNFHG